MNTKCNFEAQFQQTRGKLVIINIDVKWDIKTKIKLNEGVSSPAASQCAVE